MPFFSPNDLFATSFFQLFYIYIGEQSVADVIVIILYIFYVHIFKYTLGVCFVIFGVCNFENMN